MNAFLDFLQFIFLSLFTIVVVVVIVCWIVVSIETLHYTKQNNVLIRELCVENGLNVDSLLNAAKNDTLNLKNGLKGE